MLVDTGIGNSAFSIIDRSKIEMILNDIADEYGAFFYEAAGLASFMERRKESLRILEKTEDDLHGIQKRIKELDRQALEDGDSEDNRKKELVAQKNDLESVIKDLRIAIECLTGEARKQFESTLRQIKNNLCRIFALVCVGGEASVSLDEHLDPLESPIHINARFAGKQMRGFMLLSPQERILLALSLFLSLLFVRSPTFVILDEIDGMLDNTNKNNFYRLLRELFVKTQIIVITRDKVTMAASNLLIGVTHIEQGISTLVSVKFEESTSRNQGKVKKVPHVYISYLREDYQKVRKLADELEAFGINTWIDRDKLQPGVKWPIAIRDAIEGG
jgi:chromosome segregation ATPase